jgi:hypothetical protein
VVHETAGSADSDKRQRVRLAPIHLGTIGRSPRRTNDGCTRHRARSAGLAWRPLCIVPCMSSA